MITIQYSAWPVALNAKRANGAGVVGCGRRCDQRKEVDVVPREGREARRRSAGQRDAISLPPRDRPPPGEGRGRADRLQQTEKVRRQIRQGPSQGNVVIYVQAARRWIDPPGLRDGLRAHGLAAFRGRLAWTPVRGWDPQEHAVIEEIHRVR